MRKKIALSENQTSITKKPAQPQPSLYQLGYCATILVLIEVIYKVLNSTYAWVSTLQASIGYGLGCVQ